MRWGPGLDPCLGFGSFPPFPRSLKSVRWERWGPWVPAFLRAVHPRPPGTCSSTTFLTNCSHSIEVSTAQRGCRRLRSASLVRARAGGRGPAPPSPGQPFLPVWAGRALGTGRGPTSPPERAARSRRERRGEEREDTEPLFHSV